MRKNIKRYIFGYGMVTIRPYLTASEIGAILDLIKDEPNYAESRLMMYGYVLSICTDMKELKEENISAKLIETYLYDGVCDRITKHIKGFDILTKGYDNTTLKSVCDGFNNVLTLIENMTKQFKDIDIDKTTKEFEDKIFELDQVVKERDKLSGKQVR